MQHAASLSPAALEANGIPVLGTGARFVGPGHIEAGDRCFQNTALLIATGARAAPPPLPGRPACRDEFPTRSESDVP